VEYNDAEPFISSVAAPPMTVIHGKRLTTFDVAADGQTVSINVADEEARPGRLVLAADCLMGLIMTLPEMMRQALWRKHQDSSLRLVYPVDTWEIEESERPGTLILTLRTSDGFHMSFGVAPSDLDHMAKTGVNPVRPALRH
jgi:hypothetical protein